MKKLRFSLTILLVLFYNVLAELRNEANNKSLFANVMRIFNVNKPRGTGFYIRPLERFVVTSTLQLIFPSNLSTVKQTKRCVLSAKLRKNPNVMVAIKLEINTDMRSSYSSKLNTISCGRSYSIDQISTEHQMNKLMNNRPSFIKYYANYFAQVPTQSGRYTFITSPSPLYI